MWSRGTGRLWYQCVAGSKYQSTLWPRYIWPVQLMKSIISKLNWIVINYEETRKFQHPCYTGWRAITITNVLSMTQKEFTVVTFDFLCLIKHQLSGSWPWKIVHLRPITASLSITMPTNTGNVAAMLQPEWRSCFMWEGGGRMLREFN